jgi:hypothetical protein
MFPLGLKQVPNLHKMTKNNRFGGNPSLCPIILNKVTFMDQIAALKIITNHYLITIHLSCKNQLIYIKKKSFGVAIFLTVFKGAKYNTSCFCVIFYLIYLLRNIMCTISVTFL